MDQQAFANYTAYANRLNVPAIVSEFSCSDANDENQAMVDRMGGDLLSWTIWAYYTKDAAGCPTEGLLINDNKPGSEANAKQDKLNAIVVPYPQAIAGTPESYSYDRSTDTMKFSYTARAVAGARLARRALTQIFVPERHYQHGYRVKVTGARVVSSRTSPWVELRARRGAKVSVTITPAKNSKTLRPLAVCPAISAPGCG
jgi:endoglycosylceramidase